MKFKNDKERLAFLDDYRNEQKGWYLWKEDYDLKRQWWRFDLPDCALIVEEQLITYHYPDTHVDHSIIHWYIIKDWKRLFADLASRTLALQEVKRCGKLKS